MELKIKYFGMTCSVFWGLAVFTTTWWLIARGLYLNEMTFLGAIYPYYSVSPLGSLIGLVYGLADGFFAGVIFAWFYNLLVKKGKNRSEEKGENHEQR